MKKLDGNERKLNRDDYYKNIVAYANKLDNFRSNLSLKLEFLCKLESFRYIIVQEYGFERETLPNSLKISSVALEEVCYKKFNLPDDLKNLSDGHY